jgi:hypothetical protein
VFNGDTAVPGLPGSGTSNAGLDNFVQEIITYLELKAGAHIWGLNVDDGYIISSSPNPRDTLGTLLGFRAGPGGNAGSPLNNPNAAFSVIVPEDGIYPVRILWWQGGGGVNLEFASIDRETGTQVLVNDTSGLFPSTVTLGGDLVSEIRAYNTYTGPVRPWVKFSVYPMPNVSTLWQNQHQQSGPGPITVATPAGNPADIANDSPNIRPFGDSVGAIVADLGNGTVGMVLNGENVTPTISNVPGSNDKLVSFTPTTPLPSGSTNTAGLIYAGTTNYWSFIVMTYTNVPAGTAVPVSSANATASGFRVRTAQATNSQPNTVARAEAQLAGTIPNVGLPGPGADGSYIVTNVINFSTRRLTNASGGEIGNFISPFTPFADQSIPGISGTAVAGAAATENIAAEVFAYLELPAGYHKFGVNGDDGWKVQIGRPGETNGVVLFTTDRGAGSRDIPFAFVTTEAGLYPVRLVWYNGGGHGDLEFFTYGPNNTKIAVNDRSNPNAVKAYYDISVNEGPRMSVRLSGGNIIVEWTGGGTLQSATSVTGPWTSTGDNDGSFSTPATGEARFFRVVR